MAEVTIHLVDGSGTRVREPWKVDLIGGHLALTGSGGLLEQVEARSLRRHQGNPLVADPRGLSHQSFAGGETVLLEVLMPADEPTGALVLEQARTAGGKPVHSIA